MNAELIRWQTLANQRITPIENIKTRIFSIRESIDQQFPAWRVSYDTNPQDYLSHDARREYFISLRVILQNAQLGYIYIRDHLTNENWWRSQIGEFREAVVFQALREQALMLKFYSFHAIAVVTEETCRAIVRAAPNIFGVRWQDPFYRVYSRLLELARCRQYEELFEVMRLTRNTIHTNGVFSPNDRQNQTISYGGRSFLFEVNRTLSWMGDDFPEWLAAEMSVAMQCVVSSPIVSGISQCPRGG